MHDDGGVAGVAEEQVAGRQGDVRARRRDAERQAAAEEVHAQELRDIGRARTAHQLVA